MFKRLALTVGLLAAALPAAAQQPAAAPGRPTTICGSPIPPPRALPPANSEPVLFVLLPCFEAQGNQTLIDPQTYLYYISLKDRVSRPSEGVWTPYTDETERIIREDFLRLWNTKFLDNIVIDVRDYVFANGVIGKIVVYNLEERQRIKIVDADGSKEADWTKITERLREQNAEIRTDSFADPALVR